MSQEKSLPKPAGWKEVSFTKASWLRLKQTYGKAVVLGLKSFTFNGEEYDVGFAKYFIEYHDQKFK